MTMIDATPTRVSHNGRRYIVYWSVGLKGRSVSRVYVRAIDGRLMTIYKSYQAQPPGPVAAAVISKAMAA